MDLVSTSASLARDAGEAAPRIRVLYLVHTLARGGSASSLSHMIAHLPRDQVEAHVLAPAGPAAAQFEAIGVPVEFIGDYVTLDSIAGVPLSGFRLLTLLRAAWALRHTRRLRRVIRRLRPDLVHLNERGMLHAAMVSHGEGVPVVMHARSVADRHVRWYRRLWGWVVGRSVDAIIAIDESVRRSLPASIPVAVVYNPLGGTAPPAEMAKETGDVPVRVTYLSGLLRAKGVWDLLDAALVLRDRTDIVFQIAGSNPRPATFYRSPVGRACARVGLVEDVERGVQEWIDRHDMRERVVLLGHVEDQVALFRASDILVYPSHQGAPSRSVFEAGVHAVPSILTMDERVEDVVVDGVTGVIVPQRDPASLVRAITRLADDAPLRRRMGANAQHRYRQQFDAHASAAAVLAIYRRVLAARASRKSR